MGTINSVFLSLGSNLGNKKSNLNNAISLIEERLGEIVKTSTIHESEAWGFNSNHTFYNQVIEIQTLLLPNDLLEITQKIEVEIGRHKKTVKNGYESRLIDIDIIFFNDVIHSDDLLTIPHPLFDQRNFVMLPLEEIAPNKVDPKTSHSLR